MSIRVICINKDDGDHDDPHEAITYLGWVDEATQRQGRCTRLEMVKFLEDRNQAYVKDSFGKVAYLVVRISRRNNKYVKTVADGRETNNLLSLPECR